MRLVRACKHCSLVSVGGLDSVLPVSGKKRGVAMGNTGHAMASVGALQIPADFLSKCEMWFENS